MLLHFYHFLATVTDIWCNVLKLWVMKNIFVVILYFYLHDILGNLLIKLSWSCYNNPFLAIWIIRHPLTTYKMFAAQLAFSKKLLALLSFFIFKACYYFIFSLFLDWCYNFIHTCYRTWGYPECWKLTIENKLYKFFRRRCH